MDKIDILTDHSVMLLKEMISIPSPSFEENEVCSHICRWLTMNDIAYTRKDNNIICENIRNKSLSTLMLCAHIDTVLPSDEYSFNPYSPDYDIAAEAISQSTGCNVGRNDIVAGLGSNDDGASVVSMLAAYRYFLETEINLNILLVLSCEEERSGIKGMTGLWPMLSQNIDYAIVGEPTGMRAATSERGLLVIDAEATGVSGHAARNEGLNALYIAIEDINRLKEYEFDRISGRMGKVNLNVTQINAGTAHNVIPDRCTFVIDIRPTEKYDNSEILEELQAICKSRLKARNLRNCSSATSEGSVLQKIAEEMNIETYSSPTTSDWMRISCDAIKMGPGESSRSHKKNEFVFVDEIRKGIEIYINFITGLAENEYTLE